MMALKTLLRFWLGRHHPPVLSATGRIRTTTNTATAIRAAAARRTLEMASKDISIATEHSRMPLGQPMSQINSNIKLHKICLYKRLRPPLPELEFFSADSSPQPMETHPQSVSGHGHQYSALNI
jgi:hypothetical protein